MPSGDKIQPKVLDATWVISRQVVLQDRNQLPGLFKDLKRIIPAEAISGPPFCIIQFITSLTEGSDAEIGFPVKGPVPEDPGLARQLPAVEVLSLSHQGPPEGLGESYRRLYGWAAERGIISDEFCREVYLNPDKSNLGEIEVQFVIHPWHQLFDDHLSRVLGSEKANQIKPGSAELTVGSTLKERFAWVRKAVEGLEDDAGEGECYQVLSSCAHVFPAGQIAKLRGVYQAAKKQTGEPLQAVDAVIDFMGEDPGWGEKPRREGNTVYSSKNPRDPAAYEKATSLEEKRKAYCFCPLIRENLGEGMPSLFCYCGAGWYRQQWEGAIGQPVKIEITRSLLKGDDRCEFAIQLPGVME